MQQYQTYKKNEGINYNIVKFFLDNTRITILSFILLIVIGAVATLNLKTTGFPGPEIKLAIVQTIYPGASSESVLDNVTKPLESAIKDIAGVSNYNSTSNNSLSLIRVSIDQNANTETVKSKLDGAIKSAKLPQGAETPIITSPDVGGPDFVFSIIGGDRSKIYAGTQSFNKILDSEIGTSKVEHDSKLEKSLVVNLKSQKISEESLDTKDIERRIRSLGESIPVVDSANVDGRNVSILTTTGEKNIDSLTNLIISTTNKDIKLGDIATFDVDYQFKDKKNTLVSYRLRDSSVAAVAEVLIVKNVKGTDQNKYFESIKNKLKSENDLVLNETGDVENLEKPTVILSFSSAESSSKQVNEVIGGLIGSPLDLNSDLKYAGWLLGGIQLVFLTMIMFVSWRAGIIAALAIPLSLLFSNIYLYIRGESLNTLVLFSLVLVIGLVVDPALVILESLQRKIDAGLRGKDAALAAIKDVGAGLFLASFTNIIVFAPFGVISGILGQIFGYIPLTIVPALVASYIIPLIFLTWLGSVFIRPSSINQKIVEAKFQSSAAILTEPNDNFYSMLNNGKRFVPANFVSFQSLKNSFKSKIEPVHEKTIEEIEEENMWWIAKQIVRINNFILSWHHAFRTIFVVVVFTVPFVVAGVMFSTGAIKPVQFSSSGDGRELAFVYQPLSTLSLENKNLALAKVLQLINSNPNVKNTYPLLTHTIQINLSEPKVRVGNTAGNIAKSLTKSIEEACFNGSGPNCARLKDQFFDYSFGVVSNGPPAPSYQIALSVKSEDQLIIQKSAIEVGKVLQNVCYRDIGISIDGRCEFGTKQVAKIDDGFTNKENKVVEVIADSTKIEKQKLIIPNAPLTLLVNQKIKELYQASNTKIQTIKSDVGEVPVFLSKDNLNAGNVGIDIIKNLELDNLQGQKIRLGDIARIEEKNTAASIQRNKGENITVIQAQLLEGKDDQSNVVKVSNAVLDYFNSNDSAKLKELGLATGSLTEYSEGSSAGFAKSFLELLTALVLAIILSYFVLAVFFNSLSMPLVILFTIPLTFVGVFPALRQFTNGEFGFLEIIGFIILVGIVENVAIFLIDAARTKIKESNWDDKRAIAWASGIRFRPVILTKMTAIASLAPLAFLSDSYRSISIVIIFGLLTSGITSLFTTPVLFIFFRWLSAAFRQLSWYNKILFFPLFPIYIVVMGLMSKGS